MSRYTLNVVFMFYCLGSVAVGMHQPLFNTGYTIKMKQVKDIYESYISLPTISDDTQVAVHVYCLNTALSVTYY